MEGDKTLKCWGKDFQKEFFWDEEYKWGKEKNCITCEMQDRLEFKNTFN